MDNYAYQPEETNGKNSGQPFAITRYPSVRRADYLVEVNSRSKFLKKSNLFKILTIILAILVLILLVLLTTFVILYCKKYYENQICTSEECLRSAANLRLSLDYTADPCDNFYQFTCGRWSEEHPNHGWFPSFSTFSTITERVLISTERFLIGEESSEEDPDQQPKPVKQARDFYRACMDSEAVDRLGLSVLFKYLQDVDLPLVPSIFTKTDDEIATFKFDWMKTETKIKKVFSMDGFLGFTVDANTMNRTENVMYFGTPGQKCPLPSPLKRNSQDTQIKKKQNEDSEVDFATVLENAKAGIVRYVLSIFVRNATGEEVNQDTLETAISAILNISKYVDELSSNHTSLLGYGTPYSIKDYQTKTNEYLMNNINQDYPQVIEKYISFLFEGINVTVDFDKDAIFISEEEAPYPPKILAYILTTSDIYLELYLWWITVFAMIINTSSDVVEFIILQTSPFYIGNPIVRSRSLDCSVLTNDFMGMAVGYGIADKAFTNRTKPKVEEMLYEIKNAFVQHVNSITWMDRETKRATLEKSKEMISFIGYPDWLFEKGALEIYYEGIEIKNDTYLENMMSIIKLFMPQRLQDLRVANERNWSTDPTTVNAFNSFPDNAINLPMAILAFPVYNLGLEVLNYGAIGSVLGHELTHGFDNTGRKHDKFGNYKQWWTNETIETFESKMECFIKQYDNFTVAGSDKHVQGFQTLGENLADNGGLNHAYIAYQNYLKKFGTERKLPGFENFTSNQLFFLAYASIWCETVTVDDLEDAIEYDEHSPNVVRVLGSLQNSQAFSDAYKCPVGSKMNPSKNKCKVW